MSAKHCWPHHGGCDHSEYVGRAVTLNGEPAKITTTPEGYARISPLDPRAGTVQYSWVAVFNVCDNHGSRF